MIQVPPNCDLTLGLTRLDSDEEGVSVWHARVDERFTNPAGLVQGGFLAAIADSAMGAAAVSSAPGRVFVANTDLRISFLRAVRPGDDVTCTARVVRSGRQVTVVEARCLNGRGEVVATASSTYLTRQRSE